MPKKYQYKTIIKYTGPDGFPRKAVLRSSSYEQLIEQFHLTIEAIRLNNAEIATRMARAKSILAGEVQPDPPVESSSG